MDPTEAESDQEIARDLPREQLSESKGTLQQFFQVDFHVFLCGVWGKFGRLQGPEVGVGRVLEGPVGAG